MSHKNYILESWIMVEHLSEGDISLVDKTILTLNEIQEKDFYNLFLKEIKKKKMKSYQQGGIVLYLDIFPFNEIVGFLRKKYHLSPTEQDIRVGNKFSIALYFDKSLKLNTNMTFLTASYYIRKYRRIPKESNFLSFEEEYKKKFEELFECPDDADYSEHFNHTITSIMEKNNIEIKTCRMKVLLSLETDATNLHSFFIEDLEKAKTIQSNILDTYILGRTKKRINLDSRTESRNFNTDVFNRILQPINYSIARFPSNPKFSLSFMQQVALNLSIGFDNEQIRSVNGPPGTGKTTLLKDIFADLVVEQAFEIIKLSEKCIKGSKETTYWENASIGIMPKKIAEKGIVVASSNNGAVQNIVNELPLLSEIGKEFTDAIISVDYFKTIANSNISTEWGKDKNGNPHEKLLINTNIKSKGFWGLFSLEGGKKENMDYIVTVLKHVMNHLEMEYTPDDKIYQKFKIQYNKVSAYKNERQKIREVLDEVSLLLVEINNKHILYSKEAFERQHVIEEKNLKVSEDIKSIQKRIKALDISVQEYSNQNIKLQEDKNSIIQCVEALKLQKPGLFSPRKHKKNYKERNKEYSDQLQKTINDERLNRNKISEAELNIKKSLDEITKKYTELEQNRTLFDKWQRKAKVEISQLEERANTLKKKLQGIDTKELDFTVDYETLQLSNPWFDIEYRRLQSQLFITALQVRKQFLYENKKNIKASYLIWSKPKEHLSRKIVISEAWNWINMVIPVISSTFASFSRMCANMDKETIGHLFIDEAGQALPQASIGAIFRSKNVMAVGDPSQITPISTLDSSILNMLGEYYGVSQKYLTENASTQTLVDEISKYGFYKNNKEWIGIPLWVHRRCMYPMFDIANKISYNGNMVQGIKEKGYCEWFDIGGAAIDKYVVSQGIFLKDKIQEMISKNSDILNKEKKDIIYVITPFKNVAYQLSQELNKIGFTRYDKSGKPTNVGTVHTFQGKEAPIVFLVLGADEQSKGAANWAMGTENPNIMNVAATRAKKQFYIVGEKKLYLGLKSEVINDVYEIIENYNSLVEV